MTSKCCEPLDWERALCVRVCGTLYETMHARLGGGWLDMAAKDRTVSAARQHATARELSALGDLCFCGRSEI